jgi:hypothetical protein
VDQVAMVTAQQHQVVRAGLPAMQPVADMMAPESRAESAPPANACIGCTEQQAPSSPCHISILSKLRPLAAFSGDQVEATHSDKHVLYPIP